MKKKKSLLFAGVAIFTLILMLNINLSQNISKSSLVSLNYLKTALAQPPEGGDGQYFYDYNVYDASCLDCWDMWLSRESMTCECEEYNIQCPPNGNHDCTPEQFYVISNNCTPNGYEC